MRSGQQQRVSLPGNTGRSAQHAVSTAAACATATHDLAEDGCAATDLDSADQRECKCGATSKTSESPEKCLPRNPSVCVGVKGVLCVFLVLQKCAMVVFV